MQTHLRQQPRAGFTLIELLTVIAIIGILAAILIPTVSKVRETARRTVDQSNIRQIGQAALIYSSDNDGRLPGTKLSSIGENSTSNADLIGYAAALARSGGLNDATLWMSGSDTETSSLGFSTVLNGDKTALVAPFGSVSTLSFVTIAGLATNLPSTTPIAFSRGLTSTGAWDTKTAAKKGLYGNEGGHIVFLGGNVQFYRDVKGSDGTGALIDTAGARTKDVMTTVNSTSTVFLALPSVTAP